MTKYSVYHSARFDKELEKFDKDFTKWLNNVEDQLTVSPYSGDPLGVEWFREKNT
jgi:mRNA-degrading endonuclease RelE of RelBE toxin-antitoxin system